MNKQQEIFSSDVYSKSTLDIACQDLMELVDHWYNPTDSVRVTVDLDELAHGLALLGEQIRCADDATSLRWYLDGTQNVLSAFCGIDADVDINDNGLIDVAVACNGRTVRKKVNVERGVGVCK